MKYPTKIEVILSTKFSSEYAYDKGLLWWLTPAVQSAVGKQLTELGKLYVKTTNDSTPIHLS